MVSKDLDEKDSCLSQGTLTALKGIGHTWSLFCHFHKGDDFCESLFAFLHINPLLKRCTLKGKNLLPRGANSFHLQYNAFQKGIKYILKELPPLKVPLVTLRNKLL